MTVDVYAHYQPKNKFNVDWEAVREVHTSGDITEGSGYISSHGVSTGYRVNISYDGSVDIGDRRIRNQVIPNYWNHAQVLREAERQSGVSLAGSCGVPYSTCGIETAVTISICLCVGLCVMCCRNKKIEARKERYGDALEKAASYQMAIHVAKLLKEADEVVSTRIEEIERNRKQVHSTAGGNSGGSGTLTLTNEQLASLLAAAAQQFQQPSVIPVTATIGTQLGILNQYTRLSTSQQVLPIEHAANNMEIDQLNEGYEEKKMGNRF